MGSTNAVLLGILLWTTETQCLSPLYEAYTINSYGMKEFAALHGMQLDIYYAITADNWRLQVHRVRSPNIFNQTFSTPVLMSHGTSVTSADFMMNPRSESLAFILADNGYDVWLGNFRGNQFSYEKVTSDGTPYNAGGTEMYETAWQFAAEHDMPALVDLVLRETKQEKIHFIAHSQGGPTVLAFFADNHAYDDKVGHFAALSPFVMYGNDTSWLLQLGLRVLAPLIEHLPKFLFEKVAQAMFPGSYHSTLNKSTYLFCYFFPYVCLAPFNFVFQRDIWNKIILSPYFDKERTTVLSTIYPGGATVMTLYELSAQFYMPKKAWTKIDYRKLPHIGITNEEMYNSSEPPGFNFTNYRVNMSIVVVKNDIFTGPETGRDIIAWLKPADSLILEDDRFSHPDLTWSWKAPCMAYNFVLKQFTDFDDARGQGYLQYRRRVKEHLENLEKPRCASQNSL